MSRTLTHSLTRVPPYLLALCCIVLVSACSPNNNKMKTVEPNWHELSAIEQANLIKQGKLTSTGLVAHYLQRIEAIDSSGPKINSILSLNPTALAEAKLMDNEAANGQFRGLLHGIPILVKDNTETKELPTTAGSLAMVENMTYRDAPIIAKLREQGAIILGKTNLSEWANFRSEGSISGWSGLAGQTFNPHNLSRSSCGSSAGSGAAIAAELGSMAIGTETNGSIICPSAMNGIVGFKPTVGLLSRTHIVPISVTQDTAGPMTKTVSDAALMTQLMAGFDPLDEATVDAEKHAVNYLGTLNQPLDNLKIGVLRSAQGRDQRVISRFEDALTVLQQQGAELVEIEQFELPDDFWQHAYQVLLTEFKQTINSYLGTTPESITHRTLEQLIAFNANSPRELALFNQDIFELSQATKGYEEEKYIKALAIVRKATRENGIDKLLSDYQVDVLVAPSNSPAFLIDTVYGDHSPGGWIGAGSLAAIAGYPHLTIPMGDIQGLPVGLSVISGEWQDSKVLQVGYLYEQNSNMLVKPKFSESSRDNTKVSKLLLPNR